MNDQKLTTIFITHTCLPKELIKLIILYCPLVEYETEPFQMWHRPGTFQPYGSVTDNQCLYICDKASSLLIYTLDGKCKETLSPTPTFTQLSDIDFYNNCFYVINNTNVSILDLKFKLLSSFPSPFPKSPYLFIKVENDFIYITGSDQYQLYMYTHDGTIQKQIGSLYSSNTAGGFNGTCGIALDISSLYVCDRCNDRVQVFSKNNNYSFLTQWGTSGTQFGELTQPRSIYYSTTENIMYVGDNWSLQLFTCKGKCLQRLGGDTYGGQAGAFYFIFGICVINNTLYICDRDNGRIQVFRRK